MHNIIRNVLLLLALCPCISIAQEDYAEDNAANGIVWTTGLTWEEIRNKAKLEGKYIFVDCFTTWCKPCKDMDRFVYANDTVGQFFNEHFISVKVQMDKTKKDPPNVIGWYKEAEWFEKAYRINAYPSYLFLSPEGTVVHKETGYKKVNEFITVAQAALVPGKTYVDPYLEYEKLISAYDRGNKDYSKMIYMINTSLLLGEEERAKQLYTDFLDYLSGLKPQEILTEENIAFLGKHIRSKHKLFGLFYPDGSAVDRVMQRNGYAKMVVDNVIRHEIVFPYLKVAPGEWRTVPPDNREANWDSLYTLIRVKYAEEYAQRNLLAGKVHWYFYYNNFPDFARAYVKYEAKYGIDTSSVEADLKTNFYAWEIFFKEISDRDQLLVMVRLMNGVVRRNPADWGILDTYAGLLYKTGQTRPAIGWQEKALALAAERGDQKSVTDFSDRLQKMKKGLPTWKDVK